MELISAVFGFIISGERERRLRPGWLIAPHIDILMFGGPAAIALVLVLLQPWIAPTGEVSLSWWFLMIVGIDVGHVWSTIYPCYLDEHGRRYWKKWLVCLPLLAWMVGSVLAWWSLALFWRCLAYLAVFHFVRQQYGWVRLYQQRELSLSVIDRWLDKCAIYMSTLYPLLWWHVHMPRAYDWFMPGDFLAVPAAGWMVMWMTPVYVISLLGFALRQLYRCVCKLPIGWGKILVVSSTAVCWGIGIIATNSDWAFTTTNVLIHGVPYLCFLWMMQPASAWWHSPWVFYGVVLSLAIGEEYLWDRYVWHSLFAGVNLSPWFTSMVVGLLAVPQMTHYMLDGIIWKRGSPLYRCWARGVDSAMQGKCG